MSNPVAGATNAPKVTQVQRTQSISKAAKPANAGTAAPQDTVTISAQGRAAQQASQTHQSAGDADHDGDSK
jgi:hypothetical protein